LGMSPKTAENKQAGEKTFHKKSLYG